MPATGAREEAASATVIDTDSTVTVDETLVMRVVDAVADAKGVDPLELEPLHESIDLEALDAIFSTADGRSAVELSFSVAGCEVVVRGPDDISVTPLVHQSGAGAVLSHGD